MLYVLFKILDPNCLKKIVMDLEDQVLWPILCRSQELIRTTGMITIGWKTKFRISSSRIMIKQHLKIHVIYRYGTTTNIYLLLTEFEGRTVSYGPSFFPFAYGPSANRAGHKLTGKKRGSVTYSTDRENEVSKIFIISLKLIGYAEKEILKVSGPYSKVRPAKLTNHSTCTN